MEPYLAIPSVSANHAYLIFAKAFCFRKVELDIIWRDFIRKWRKNLYYYLISISFDLAVFFEFWQSCETKNIYTLVNHLSYPLQLWILQKYTPVSKYINYINMIYKFTKIRIRNFENWNFKILSFSWAHFPWSFSAKGKTSSSAEKVDFEIIDKLYLRHLSS